MKRGNSTKNLLTSLLGTEEREAMKQPEQILPPNPKLVESAKKIQPEVQTAYQRFIEDGATETADHQPIRLHV